MGLSAGLSKSAGQTGLDEVFNLKMPTHHRQNKNKTKIHRAFSEVFGNVPSTVRRAKVKGKRKRKMMTAIALNKARKAGARIPRRKGRK